MTELEHAITHIKTRADAWAVKEVTEALQSISERLDKALSQEPTRDIEKSNFSQEQYLLDTDTAYKIGYEQGKSEAQKSGKCKNCKYFEYDSVANVDGIPLIVAHEICNKWGNGCKTSEDGFCFMFEKSEK